VKANFQIGTSYILFQASTLKNQVILDTD